MDDTPTALLVAERDEPLREFLVDQPPSSGPPAMASTTVDAPILDELGYPRNVRGVVAVPGLYFLGLLWQHSQASASLLAPELDGPYLLDTMNRQASSRQRSASGNGSARRARRNPHLADASSAR